jgi:hypothetical protein
MEESNSPQPAALAQPELTPVVQSRQNGDTKRRRGIVLAAFLVIAAILALLYIYPIFLYKPTYRLPYLLDVFDRLLLVAGLVLMWAWKRIGVYLFVAAVILIFFSQQLMAVQNGLRPAGIGEYVISFIITSVILALFCLIIRYKWHLFK